MAAGNFWGLPAQSSCLIFLNRKGRKGLIAARGRGAPKNQTTNVVVDRAHTHPFAFVLSCFDQPHTHTSPCRPAPPSLVLLGAGCVEVEALLPAGGNALPHLLRLAQVQLGVHGGRLVARGGQNVAPRRHHGGVAPRLVARRRVARGGDGRDEELGAVVW